MNIFATRLAASFRTVRSIRSVYPLSLRASLIAGFSIVLGLLVFVGSLAIMAERTTISNFNTLLATDIKTADLSQKSVIAMMKARRYEKDFLLMYREFGFDEAKSRYVTLLQANLADARDSLAEMSRLTGDPEETQHIQSAAQAIDNYQNAFLGVVTLYGQLGFIDTGLEGQFRDNAHQIESLLNSVKDGKLIIDLLSIRRREKDYLLRGRDADSQAVRQTLAQFRRDVASAAIAAEQRVKLTSLADAYASQFERYVQTADQIELEKRRYLAAVQDIEPNLEKLLTGALARNDTAREAILSKAQQTETVIEVVGLGAIALGMIVAWLVSQRIAISIRKTMEFAAQIAAGDLRTRTTYPGRDEFSALGRSLNHMANALQDAIQSQRHREAELEDMNAVLQSEIFSRKQAESDMRKANAELEQRVLARTSELAKSEERLRRLADLSSDWYWEQDENFVFTEISNGMAKIIGSAADLYIGKTRWEMPIEMTPEDWACHKAILNAHQTFTDFEYKVHIENVGPLWFSISGEPLFDINGRFTGYRGVGTNITERKRIEEIVKHRSLHDILTGLPNRALLQDRLAHALTYATRYSHIVWVVFIDLDRFKYINDTLGHKAGDTVLNVTAKRLQSLTRESDTVARLGGDEFVLVLLDCSNGTEISSTVERIMKTVAQPLMVEGQEVFIGCSVGVAAYPLDGGDADTLVEHADAAMYRAKLSGRNNFQFYNLSMNR
jgi:diguanylate cyclase (GGDEF)-like protein/PAS domain S-box-containing protein